MNAPNLQKIQRRLGINLIQRKLPQPRRSILATWRASSWLHSMRFLSPQAFLQTSSRDATRCHRIGYEKSYLSLCAFVFAFSNSFMPVPTPPHIIFHHMNMGVVRSMDSTSYALHNTTSGFCMHCSPPSLASHTRTSCHQCQHSRFNQLTLHSFQEKFPEPP